MKISERWLREWVSPDISTQQLCEQLTMLGLEVDEVSDAGPDLAGFVVGHVDSATAHPNADRLQVCTVDIGADAPKTIVCGAPNARAGLKVAVATVGARMPNGMQIKAAKLRGQASEGMLCSRAELGMGADSDGIIELNATAPVGAPLAEHLALPDTVLDIDLTPNRGDCLSVRGVAREVAVVNRLALVEPEITPLTAEMDSSIGVTIEAPQLCPGYMARCVFAIDPDAPTPDWMTERLRRGGVRAISLPVDICNLVMLELGQPMHAFDYDKLQGQIRIRQARAGETITTLDGQHVTLNAGTLVIADDAAPVAVAGMIGGADTAVSEGTRRVVLEAANFTQAAVAGQGRVYKIHTDSSHRFERGVDPALYPQAIERASRLLVEYGGGQAGPIIADRGDPVWPDQRRITLELAAVERLLGQAIPADACRQALTALGMHVSEANPEHWTVVPPSWRFDMAIEADLIEEIARIYGYDRLLEDPKGTILPPIDLPEGRLDEQQLCATLQQRGYSEAITYSFVEPKLQALFSTAEQHIDLANPIAEQLAQMRETLWASLLPAWAHNRRRQHGNIRLYEIGQRFAADAQADNGVAQIDTLAGIVDGEAQPRHWALAGRDIDFFDIKGDVEALFAMSGRQPRFVAEQRKGLHPGRSAAIYLGETRVGYLGQLAPEFAKIYKVNRLPYLFELDYSAVQWHDPIRYEPISEQPSVQRDLAVVVTENTPAGDLVTTINALQDPQLQTVDVFDLFYPEGLESGFKSVALSLIFQDKKSTLTDSAVDAKLERVISALELHNHAQIRGPDSGTHKS